MKNIKRKKVRRVTVSQSLINQSINQSISIVVKVAVSRVEPA